MVCAARHAKKKKTTVAAEYHRGHVLAHALAPRTHHTHTRRFFAAFPEYASSDIYLAGESYAGQYIPNIATHLLDPAGGAYDDIGARLKVGRRRRRRVAVARAIAVGREGEGE